MNFREEGFLLYQEGRYASALETFLAEAEQSPADPELSYYIGLCHARLGDTRDAMDHMRDVLARDRHLIRLYQARMVLAWLMVETDDIEEAQQQLRAVLQEGFESPQAWSALGYCQWKQGRVDLARNSYREALRLDGENSNAANGLGYLLADTGGEPDEAVELCRRAVESDPDNMAYRDSLGWALFRAGQTVEAIRHLTEALTNRPDDPTIRTHLEAVRTNDHVQDQ